MQDPVVAAAVTDSMVRKLEEYMGDYRTEKAKRDLAFTQESYQSAARVTTKPNAAMHPIWMLPRM